MFSDFFLCSSDIRSLNWSHLITKGWLTKWKILILHLLGNYFVVCICAWILDRMDLNSGSTSPVLTDNTRLGIHSGLLPYSHSGSAFSPLFLTIPRKRPGLLDDVKSSLLDTMISSSPTHNKLLKESNNETAQSDADLAYRNWMV